MLASWASAQPHQKWISEIKQNERFPIARLPIPYGQADLGLVPRAIKSTVQWSCNCSKEAATLTWLARFALVCHGSGANALASAKTASSASRARKKGLQAGICLTAAQRRASTHSAGSVA